MNTQAGLRAVVVGASSGMGREVARLLAADGWHVAVAARRADRLEQLCDECRAAGRAPAGMTAAAVDVTAADGVERLMALIDSLGGIDLLFYAAGVGWKNVELDASTELTTVDTNAVGFTRVVGAVYRYMAVHGGGHIAVISSIAGTKGLGAAPAYSATKAYQNTYIQALEQQARMRRLDICFTDLRPGFVATPLLGDGGGYPMLMDSRWVARRMVRCVYARRHVCVIDGRYRLLTLLWRLVPPCLWRRLTRVR